MLTAAEVQKACERKRGIYATEDEAMAMVVRAWLEYGEHGMLAYRCANCGLYHIAHAVPLRFREDQVAQPPERLEY